MPDDLKTGMASVVYCSAVSYLTVFQNLMITTIAKYIIVFLLCLVPGWASAKDIATDSLMRQLDEVVRERDVYVRQREKRLKELRRKVNAAEDLYSRFDALGKLLDEFTSFNTDSAYAICLERENIAYRMGKTEHILHARMNRANILNATAMYKECLELMDSIPFSQIPSYLHPFYYHIKRTVYGRMADYSPFAPEKIHYIRLTDNYRDSLLSINDPASLEYALISADKMNAHNKPEDAIRIIRDYQRGKNLGEHDNAIFAWSLAESYGLLDDKDNQKRQLLISSISDMKSATREYVSLRQLALFLYNEGDLERAHGLMSIAVDDAEKCNARHRIVEINSIYKKVNGIYIEKIQEQKETLGRTIIAISVLSVLLLLLLFYSRRQVRRVAEARKATQEAYDKLNKVNEELLETNRSLNDANNDIREISAMKEVYIGRYMDQCLEYIDKLDAYRKTIARQIGGGKLDDLRRSLQSTAAIDKEYKDFYEQFDRSFLSLFPSFVNDFNGLLRPEEAIIPKKDGCLNAELRIFALIRLGINDSEKIAKFLRYSLPTIYTYRTKVRNKASGDRNQLETDLMKIGRS